LRIRIASNSPSGRVAAGEPVARVVAHGDRVRAPERDPVAEPEVAQLEVMQLPAASLRGEHHRQRRVLRRLDVLDRVHHDGDAQALAVHRVLHMSAGSPRARVTSVMVSKPADGGTPPNMLKLRREHCRAL
jgi:hypothetical protein